MIKEIAKKIHSITGKMSHYEIFSDWIEMYAIALQNSCYLFNDEIFKEREEKFIQIRKKYNDTEFDTMTEMCILLQEALKEPTDVLGEVYMELGNWNKSAGQFFTPNCVALAHTQMALSKIPIEKKHIKVYEPTSGSGTNIIAIAKTLKLQGRNYQNILDVVCQDLDLKAVYMTYIQLFLLGISAKVIQGDVLETNPKKIPPENVWFTAKKLGVFV